MPADLRGAIQGPVGGARHSVGAGRAMWIAAGAAVLAGVAGTALLVGRDGGRPLDPFEPWAAAALGLAGAGWALAVWTAPRAAGRGAGVFLVVVALALRAAVLLAPAPQTSDDVNRYVWEGELVRGGRSPYAWAPDDPALSDVRARLPAIHAGTNHPEVSAAYPPVAQAAFAGVVASASAAVGADRGDELERAALFGMRAFFALCDLLVLIPLAVLLRRAGRPPTALVAWGWSPLVALEFAGAAHFDSLGILLWTSGLAFAAVSAATPARRLVGLALEVAAVLVKLLPVCGLPFVHRGRGALRDAGVAALLVLAAFAPLLALEGGFSGLGAGLSQYALRWESTSLLYRHVEPLADSLAAALGLEGGWADPRRLGRAAIGGVWLALAAFLWFRRVEPVRACGVLVGAFLVLSPTLHPWYLAWVVPFVALRPGLAWTWLLAAAPWLYAPLARWRDAGVWEEPAWLWPGVAVPFLVLLVVDAARAAFGDGEARAA